MERLNDQALKLIFDEKLFHLKGDDTVITTSTPIEAVKNTSETEAPPEKQESKEEVKAPETSIQTEEMFDAIIACSTDIKANQEALNLLDKILGAISIQIDKCDILTNPDTAVISSKKKTTSNLLFFGVDPQDHGLANTEKNKVSTVDIHKIIFTYSLEELQANVEYKKELWGALKSGFNN